MDMCITLLTILRAKWNQAVCWTCSVFVGELTDTTLPVIIVCQPEQAEHLQHYSLLLMRAAAAEAAVRMAPGYECGIWNGTGQSGDSMGSDYCPSMEAAAGRVCMASALSVCYAPQCWIDSERDGWLCFDVSVSSARRQHAFWALPVLCVIAR